MTYCDGRVGTYIDQRGGLVMLESSCSWNYVAPPGTCQPGSCCIDGSNSMPCTTTGPSGNQCTGTQVCINGQWSFCQPDPSCSQCTSGQTQACTASNGCTGTQTCSDGAWGTCQPDPSCCKLKITSFTGSSATLDPVAGGTINLTGSISDSSGEIISWAVNVNVAGRIFGGTGPTASVIWDGKNANGKVVGPGTYTATLSAQTTADCTDSKDVTITITPIDDCKFQVTIGSSANIASGNLSHSQDLFTMKGTGLATSMSLYYNSLDPYAGPLGTGWVHSYDIALKENSNSSVVLRTGNGSQRLYTKSGSGYTSQTGEYSVLTKSTDGTFAITRPDGSKYNFGTDSKITSIVDRNNNAMTMTYTGGNLIAINDPAGRITTLSYDTANHITSITDPNGNVYSFTGRVGSSRADIV